MENYLGRKISNSDKSTKKTKKNDESSKKLTPTLAEESSKKLTPTFTEDKEKSDIVKIKIKSKLNYNVESKLFKKFDLEFYKNNISENIFNEKMKIISDDEIYINILMNDTEKSQNNDKYINFGNGNKNFIDIKALCEVKSKYKIIEIFAINGIGISTYLYVNFSKLRNEKLIPFIYLDLEKIYNFENIHDFMKYIYFSITNLFVEFIKYENFCKKIFFEIKNTKNIQKIIILIIENYMKEIAPLYKEYNPCIIIDHYTEKHKDLYYTLIYDLHRKYAFKTMSIYMLKEKFSNERLLKSFLNKTNYFIPTLILYFDKLYSFLDLNSQINKYNKSFEKIFPSISNYKKFKSLKNEEEVNSFIEKENETIKKEILHFYNNDHSYIEMFVNSISTLINKKLNIMEESIQSIFVNIPLNYFYISKTKKTKLK